jgi:hypothetical protein
VSSAPTALLDALLSQLPAAVLLPELHGTASSPIVSSSTPSSDPATAETIATLTPAQKRAALTRVLHGPQFAQALAALTTALRDGGLPTVSGALGVKVENGGYARGGVPLGGGDAVEAFVRGVERTVEEEDGKKEEGEGQRMDMS